MEKHETNKSIYLAGGCFWGTQHYLHAVPGVVFTEVGYANGNTENPTYQDVCHKDTGFAETVYVEYDPSVIGLSFLLSLYYDVIDPTSVNKQGEDRGDQYRTGIYYTDAIDLPVIENSIQSLQKRYTKPIVIEVKPLKNYYRAEEYHQNYLVKNPNGYCHIRPEKLKQASQKIVDASRYARPDEEQLKTKLSKEQFEVTLHSDTEPPFQNEFWNHYEKGIYIDITSGEPLFLSSAKFESGCGWPSFSRPIDPDVITEHKDTSFGRVRTEVRSRVGNAHLGHVFNDGPIKDSGLRYCINSAALRFVPLEEMEKEGYGYLLPYVK